MLKIKCKKRGARKLSKTCSRRRSERMFTDLEKGVVGEGETWGRSREEQGALWSGGPTGTSARWRAGVAACFSTCRHRPALMSCSECPVASGRPRLLLQPLAGSPTALALQAPCHQHHHGGYYPFHSPLFQNQPTPGRTRAPFHSAPRPHIFAARRSQLGCVSPGSRLAQRQPRK